MDKKTRSIELIEDLPLKADESWYLLLAYLGLKKGSLLYLNSDVWREGESKKKVSKERLDSLKEVLDELGLFYESRALDETDRGVWQAGEGHRRRYNQLVYFYVALDKETARILKEAHSGGDDKALGLALGYPETAVEVYGTEDRLMSWSLDPEVRSTDAARHTYFVLSKQNWREELAVVQSWVDAVKQNSSLIWEGLERMDGAGS